MDGDFGDIWLVLVGLVTIVLIAVLIAWVSPDGEPGGRDCRSEEGAWGAEVVICEGDG